MKLLVTAMMYNKLKMDGLLFTVQGGQDYVLDGDKKLAVKLVRKIDVDEVEL